MITYLLPLINLPVMRGGIYNSVARLKLRTVSGNVQVDQNVHFGRLRARQQLRCFIRK